MSVSKGKDTKTTEKVLLFRESTDSSSALT